MKRLCLIFALCLLAACSRGPTVKSEGISFEQDDPAEAVIAVNEDARMDVTTAKGHVEEKIIVPVGTDLYAPNIVRGECDGWRFDESEPYLDDSNNKQFTTQTTYIGVTIKTIDCKNEIDGDTLRFALIQLEQGRLIWVELDRVISAD